MMDYERLKEQVQQEILNLLDEDIVNNIEQMKGSHTVAEIAREAILSFNAI